MDLNAIEQRVRGWEQYQYVARKAPNNIRKLREVRTVVSHMGTLAAALGDEIEKIDEMTAGVDEKLRLISLISINTRLGALMKVFEIVVNDINAELSKPRVQ